MRPVMTAFLIQPVSFQITDLGPRAKACRIVERIVGGGWIAPCSFPEDGVQICTTW